MGSMIDAALERRDSLKLSGDQVRQLEALRTEVQKAAGPGIEQWNDVPRPSEGFAMARDSIKAHVHQLIEKLDKH